MYRSILVPLDGSTFAEHALAAALTIAEGCGAKVTLVRAWDPANYRDTSELTPPFLDRARVIGWRRLTISTPSRRGCGRARQ